MNPLPFAVALCLLCLPAQAAGFAADTAVRVAGISAGGTLNVRAGAGTSNAVVAALESGRSDLTIVECTDTGDWCRIATAEGPLGWVSARYLAGAGESTGAAAVEPPEPRFDEAVRLSRVTGIAIAPGASATVPELPPYLIGEWDINRATCSGVGGATRVTVLKNGLRIGAATARFKNAIFRDGGYDLTTLLMQERDVLNAVPQRALYRLEPGETTLAVSGDVLAARRLQRCAG